MKHPKFRVRDILLLDPEVRTELFDFAWSLVDLMPFKKWVKDVELCGSLAFGTCGLASDIDFNVAMCNWDEQVTARRWYYTGTNRKEVVDRCMDYMRKYGVKIDVGVVDCDSRNYNCIASTKDLYLFNRTRSPLPELIPGTITQDASVFERLPPIDLTTFSGPLPPPFTQHLYWDAFAMRWLSKARNFPRKAEWSEDPFVPELNRWKEKYKEHFIEYKVVGNKLVEA